MRFVGKGVTVCFCSFKLSYGCLRLACVADAEEGGREMIGFPCEMEILLEIHGPTKSSEPDYVFTKCIFLRCCIFDSTL